MSGEAESVSLIQWLFELVATTASTASMVAIGLGLAGGIIVVLLTRREGASDDFDSELTDLEERKAHAVAQLRELESQRERIDPNAYTEQRAEHERVAADALRARDKLLEKRRRRTEPPGFLPDQPGLRALVWGGGAVVALVIAWLVVSPDEIPPAGAAPRPAIARAPVMNPELDQVIARLQKDPADVDALTRGAAILASMQRLDEARQYVDRALQLDPEHPGALAQYAGLLAASGRTAEALTRLDSLVAEHPDLIEAWSLRGMLAMQTGDDVKARASFDEYMKRAPDGPSKDRIRALIGAASGDKPETNSAAGAELWKAECALCHGADGEAQTPMGGALGIPDMTSPEWQKATTDERIRQVTAQGVVDEAGQRRMQAFSDLTPAQLDDLVAHIRAFAK